MQTDLREELRREGRQSRRANRDRRTCQSGNCRGGQSCGQLLRARRSRDMARAGPPARKPTMLQFFRNFFKSKFGVLVTIAFLILIAIAFGVGDVASNRTFGGVAGGDRVAVVGDRKISTSDLSS